MNQKAKEFEKKKGSLSSLDNARFKKIKQVMKRSNWSRTEAEKDRKIEEEKSKESSKSRKKKDPNRLLRV